VQLHGNGMPEEINVLLDVLHLLVLVLDVTAFIAFTALVASLMK